MEESTLQPHGLKFPQEFFGPNDGTNDRSLLGSFFGPPAPITMWDLLGFKVQNYGIWIPWHPMNGSGKIIQQYRHPIQNVVGGLCAGQCGDAPIYHRNHRGFPVNTMTDSLDHNLGTILGSHHIFGMRVLFETTIQINRFKKLTICFFSNIHRWTIQFLR